MQRVATRLVPAPPLPAALADSLDEVYARGPDRAFHAMHLIGWLASGAVLIAFRLIGVRVELSSVIAIESWWGRSGASPRSFQRARRTGGELRGVRAAVRHRTEFGSRCRSCAGADIAIGAPCC